MDVDTMTGPVRRREPRSAMHELRGLFDRVQDSHTQEEEDHTLGRQDQGFRQVCRHSRAANESI